MSNSDSPAVLLLCGSPVMGGSTWRLLGAFAKLDPTRLYVRAPDVADLPLFTPQRLASGRPTEVEVLAKAVADASAVIIATPEYAYGVPGALKSALEWLVESGEFSGKPTVALVSTPAEPRGEHCLQSLEWILKALDTNLLAQAQVYGAATKVDEAGTVGDGELTDYLVAISELLP